MVPPDLEKPPTNLACTIFNFMLPGVGQLFQGRVIIGLFWSFAVATTYIIYLPVGLAFHSLCLLDGLIFGPSKPDNLMKLIGGILVLVAFIYYLILRNDYF
jgi:hypothetical protein